MKQAIAWRINGAGKPERLAPGAVDLEKTLENWVDADVDIVADDVLVIGRQEVTTWGTKLDLLGIDAEGNLVIVELKRDQTLRETIAQGLEYAAWASKQGYDEIVAIAAERFGGEEEFQAAFAERFKTELPTALNQLQRVLVVAPSIDDTTDLVVNYLADTYRLPINAVSFDVFGTAPNQVLVRHFVREHSESPKPPTAKTARRQRTLAQIQELAAANGVGEVVAELLKLQDLLPQPQPHFFSFNLRRKTADGKRRLSAFSVYPTGEYTQGAAEVFVGAANIADAFGVPLPEAEAFVVGMEGVAERTHTSWKQWAKFLVRTPPEAAELCARFRALVARDGPIE